MTYTRTEAHTPFEQFVIEVVGNIQEHDVRFNNITVRMYTSYTEVLYLIYNDILFDKKYDLIGSEKRQTIVKNRFYKAFPYMKK